MSLATYSIRDLEKLSGIKAHTIRIWEQRYHLIEPKRTNTNIRYYTEDDLKYILNVAFLNKHGVRISKIAEMSSDEVLRRVASISKDQMENTQLLQSLTMSMVEMDETRFEEIYEKHRSNNGDEDTLQYLILPFLEKLSLLWLTGTISMVHEQFIQNLIRQKIYASLDRLPKIKGKKPKFMLYLNKGEEQDLSLILIHYFLRARNWFSLFLGQGLDRQDLALALNLQPVPYLITSISEAQTKSNKQGLREYYEDLLYQFQHTEFLVLAGQSVQEQLPQNHRLQCFELVEDLLDFIEERKLLGQTSA